MQLRRVQCKSAVSPSRLPGLDWALNPYRGCAHGCSYCYAQDVTRFETSAPWGETVEAKVNVAAVLKRELEKGPRGVYGLGTVTDPYQPAEKELELTRSCLMMLRRYEARTSILTKSDLVVRDLDLLSGWRDVEVGISIGCVDDEVARLLEPGAPGPSERLKAARKLRAAGVDAYVMVAPIVKGLSDSDDALDRLVAEVAGTGVRRMMWDKLNRKPLAHARLVRLREEGVLPYVEYHSTPETLRVKRALESACSRADIDLLDAF